MGWFTGIVHGLGPSRGHGPGVHVLYTSLLRLLKSTCAPPDNLILFYCCIIRSVVEYASPVFHSSLPKYLSDEVERIEKRALKIIFPDCSYSEALKRADLPALYARRVFLSNKLFNSISSSRNQKLSNLLLPPGHLSQKLRSNKRFIISGCKSNWLKELFYYQSSVVISCLVPQY